MGYCFYNNLAFSFSLKPVFPILKSVCQDKISSEGHVAGQCVLFGNLTSLVLSQSCFNPFLCDSGLIVEYKTSAQHN